jgi:hypothetical protein
LGYGGGKKKQGFVLPVLSGEVFSGIPTPPGTESEHELSRLQQEPLFRELVEKRKRTPR